MGDNNISSVNNKNNLNFYDKKKLDKLEIIKLKNISDTNVNLDKIHQLNIDERIDQNRQLNLQPFSLIKKHEVYKLKPKIYLPKIIPTTEKDTIQRCRLKELFRDDSISKAIGFKKHRKLFMDLNMNKNNISINYHMQSHHPPDLNFDKTIIENNRNDLKPHINYITDLKHIKSGQEIDKDQDNSRSKNNVSDTSINSVKTKNSSNLKYLRRYSSLTREEKKYEFPQDLNYDLTKIIDYKEDIKDIMENNINDNEINKHNDRYDSIDNKVISEQDEVSNTQHSILEEYNKINPKKQSKERKKSIIKRKNSTINNINKDKITEKEPYRKIQNVKLTYNLDSLDKVEKVKFLERKLYVRRKFLKNQEQSDISLNLNFNKQKYCNYSLNKINFTMSKLQSNFNNKNITNMHI